MSELKKIASELDNVFEKAAEGEGGVQEYLGLSDDDVSNIGTGAGVGAGVGALGSGLASYLGGSDVSEALLDALQGGAVGGLAGGGIGYGVGAMGGGEEDADVEEVVAALEAEGASDEEIYETLSTLGLLGGGALAGGAAMKYGPKQLQNFRDLQGVQSAKKSLRSMPKSRMLEQDLNIKGKNFKGLGREGGLGEFGENRAKAQLDENLLDPEKAKRRVGANATEPYSHKKKAPFADQVKHQARKKGIRAKHTARRGIKNIKGKASRGVGKALANLLLRLAK